MRFLLLALLCLAAVIAYVQRLGINTAEEFIRDDLVMSLERMGDVMAAWSLGYALLQIPSGWLADLWGSRRALTLLMILWSVLTGLTSLAPNYPTLLALWFCMG